MPQTSMGRELLIGNAKNDSPFTPSFPVPAPWFFSSKSCLEVGSQTGKISTVEPQGENSVFGLGTPYCF